MLDVLVDMTALNTPSHDRGIGRYVKGLCGALAQRASWPGELARQLGGEALGLSIAGLVRHRGAAHGAIDPTLQFAGDPSVPKTNLRYQRHKLERRLFLGSLARRTGARLLHLPDPPGTPIDRRMPRVVTCHDLIPLVLGGDYLLPIPGGRAVQRARDRARYAGALRVIAISHATKRDLVEHLGIAPERIDVTYHGVDHDRFHTRAAPGERERVAAHLGTDAPYLVCLGASDSRKNLPMLLRAFAQSGVARDVRLVLGGPLSNARRARLLDTARAYGVTAGLHLLGYVEEDLVPALYRQALAHVFPSSYEGFGLPLLEAMACGTPTLTSTVSSLGEVAGEAALTIDRPEVDALAASIRRMVDDGELRASLRERGLAWAAQFTWQRCAAGTLESYARALAEARW